MKEKIDILLLCLKLNQKELAHKLKISPSTVTEIKKGRSGGFPIDCYKSLYNDFNVNLNWLLGTADGPVIIKNGMTGYNRENLNTKSKEFLIDLIMELRMSSPDFDSEINHLLELIKNKSVHKQRILIQLMEELLRD